MSNEWGDGMKAQFLTDRGLVRGHNEDSGGIYYNSSGDILAIIADGMGGHQAGDVASQMAVSIMQEHWNEHNEFNSPEEVEEWLVKILKHVNTAIYDQALSHDEYAGMGTTIVVTISTNEFVTIAHIGDSRCYLYNESGFQQMTEDHSLVSELVRSGQISPEDAVHHPRKNIVLKALGTEESVSADVQSLSWEQGNKILLCSDGLTDKVSNDELGEYVKSTNSLKDTAQTLIDLANERGGEDNISLIIISHEAAEKVGEDKC